MFGGTMQISISIIIFFASLRRSFLPFSSDAVMIASALTYPSPREFLPAFAFCDL